MRRLTWRDATATILTAAAVGLYWTFLAETGLPLFSSTRAVAAGALVLGIASCAIGSEPATGGRSRRTDYRMLAVVGALAMIAGLLAIVTGSAVVLAIQIGATVALWLVTTLRHLLFGRQWDTMPPSESTESKPLTGAGAR